MPNWGDICSTADIPKLGAMPLLNIVKMGAGGKAINLEKEMIKYDANKLDR
jgi:hypothetical protein